MEKGKIVKKMDSVVDKVTWPIYFYSIVALHATYLLVFFGLLSVNKEYINVANVIVQIMVCAFLMYRFNPFRTPEIHKHDAPIIFASATFLLLNLGFTQIVYYYAKIFVDQNPQVINVVNQIRGVFGYAPIKPADLQATDEKRPTLQTIFLTQPTEKQSPQNSSIQNNMKNTSTTTIGTNEH